MILKIGNKFCEECLGPIRAAMRLAGAVVLAGLCLAAPGAQSQTYRTYPDPQQQGYGRQQGYDQQQGTRRQLSPHQLRCMKLENELANDWLKDQNPQKDQRKQIEAEIRKYDRIFQRTQAKAERSRCYQNVFIFGRSLVRTPRCIKMHNRIEDARRQLGRLHGERERVLQRSSGAGRQQRKDDLIEALAANGCGAQYQREARRRRGLFGWFSDDGFFDNRRDDLETSKIVPYATYRTLCVRECDGYYFPISFSTLPSRFQSDLQKCISQCAAPASLYVYRNPGEEPQQMVSLDGRAYNTMSNAWRYRKEYVKGCSCKVAEYSPEEIEAHGKKAADGKQKSGAAPKAGGAAASRVAKGARDAAKPR